MEKLVVDSKEFELRLLERYINESVLKEAVENASALIVRSDLVPKSVLDAGKGLKIVVRAGAGVDNIDTNEASKKGIVVMNTPGQNSNAVAELAFGLMLRLIRCKYQGGAGTELRGKRIGMHGYGHIGKSMAQIAKGFGMELFAHDPHLDMEKVKAMNVQPCKSVEELYASVDFIAINVPATNETIGMINYRLLSTSRENAMLINTARKELIDEEGLIRIMEEKQAYMYVSDVAPERKDEMEARFPMRTLFTGKKIGAQTIEANTNSAVASVKQVIDFFEKNDTTYQVNK